MKNTFLLFFLSNAFWLHAQSISIQVINSTGKQLSNTDVSLEYSVGEMSITTFNNSNYQLTQGFLQNDQSTTLTGIVALEDASSISVFPNPTQGQLFIQASDIALVSIFNQLGLMVSGYSHKESITLANLPAGIYFLKLYNTQNQLIKTSKITKQ